jgi:hypothetical protein
MMKMNHQEDTPMDDAEIIKQKLAQNSGMFLEAAVTAKLNATGLYYAERNFTHIFSFNGDSEQIDIDVVASHPDPKVSKLILAIECKREYSANKYWIIEDSSDFTDNVPELLSVNPDLNFNITGSHVDYSFRMTYFQTAGAHRGQFKAYSNIVDFDLGKDAKKSKLEGNAVPYRALTQANTAATAFAQNFSALKPIHYVDRQKVLILPVVVTTANLRILKYSVPAVSISRGSISTDELELEEAKWVPFVYTLPHKLQLRGTLNGKTRLQPSRRLCFIVQAEHLEEFSKAIAGDFDMTYGSKNSFV